MSNGYDYFEECLGKTFPHDNKNMNDSVEWYIDDEFTGDRGRIAADFKRVVDNYEETRFTGSLYEVRLTAGLNSSRVSDDDIMAEGVVGSTEVIDGLEASVIKLYTGPWYHDGFDVHRLNRLEGSSRHNWRYLLKKSEYDSNVDFSLFKPGREPQDEYSKIDP